MKRNTTLIIIGLIILAVFILPKLGLFSANYPSNAIKPIDINPFSNYWGTVYLSNGNYRADFSHLKVGRVKDGSDIEKYRAYVDFDTSSIPDDSVIDKIELHFCVYPPSDNKYETTEYYVGLGRKGHDYSTREDLFESIDADIAVFNKLEGSSRLWTSQGCKTLILGGQANQILEEKLPENYFTIALYSSETSNSEDYISFASSSEASGDVGPYLIIKYSGGCTPSCSGKSCGDNGCGGSCGTCSSGYTCQNYQCVSSCTPSTCSSLGKSCGSWSNNCGGTLNCGSCSSGYTCSNGACVSSPTCPTFSNVQAKANTWISGSITFQDLLNYAQSWVSC